MSSMFEDIARWLEAMDEVTITDPNALTDWERLEAVEFFTAEAVIARLEGTPA